MSDENKIIDPFTNVEYVDPEEIVVPKVAELIDGTVGGQSVSTTEVSAGVGSARIGTISEGGNECFYVGDPVAALILLGQLKSRTSLNEYGIWIGTTGQYLKYTQAGGLVLIGAGIVAGSIDIPDKNTTANSLHVDSTGNLWIGCTATQFAADHDNAAIYFLNDGTGKIRTSLKLGAGADYIELDGANKRIRTSNYVAGTFGAGAHIDKDLAEFGNIRARGSIRTANFQKDVISAIAGGQIITPDSATLAVDVATGDTQVTIATESTLLVSDSVRIKEGVQNEWMTIAKAVGSGVYKVIRDVDQRTVMDSCDSIAGWSAGGAGGTNLTLETTNFKVGTGALNFDTTGVGAEAIIEKIPTAPLNLSAFEDTGKIRFWVYLPTVTGLTGIEMIWGDNNTYANFWYKTVTVDVNGDVFAIGWNMVEIPWSSAGQNGTPNAASVGVFRVDLNGTVAAATDFVLDDIAIYPVTTPDAWTKGATVVNFGQRGQGGIFNTASEANSPYTQYFTHDGDPWDHLNTRVRIGNLNGVAGITEDAYGFFAGDYANNKYFSYDDDSGDVGGVNTYAKYTFIAAEDLILGQTVGASNAIEGQVARAIRTTTTTTLSTSANGYMENNANHHFEIDTDKFISIVTSGIDDGASDRNKYVYCSTIDRDTNTATTGGAVLVGSTRFSRICGCKLDTNKFIIFLGNYSTAAISYYIYTVSGNTITLQSSGATGISLEVIRCIQMGIDEVVLNSYTTNNNYYTHITVSTYTPAIGTPYRFTNSRMNTYGGPMVKVDTGYFLAAAEGSSGFGLCVCSASGGTIVPGTVYTGYDVTSFASPATNIAIGASETGVSAMTTIGGVVDRGSSVAADNLQLCSVGTTVYGKTGALLYKVNYSGKVISSIDLIVSPTQLGALISMTTYYAIVLQADLSTLLEIHIQGMSNMFFGIAQNSAARGSEVKVINSGKDEHQSGLVAGALYKPNGTGGFTLIAADSVFDTPTDKFVTATSSTEVVF